MERLLAAVSDPLDSAGVAAFAEECRQALATLGLRERHLPGVRAGLARLWAPVADELPGLVRRPCLTRVRDGLLAYEALAATMPHPAYPTSECRRGFSEDDSLRYTPEYLPEFGLHWVAVPRSRLVAVGWHGDRPAWWPTVPEVGLPKSLAATHDLMPVHRLTARHELDRALTRPGTGLADARRRTGRDRAGHLPAGDPHAVHPDGVRDRPAGSHIKLPAPDQHPGPAEPAVHQAGHPGGRRARAEHPGRRHHADPLLGGLLLADEGTYAHAGHPYLAYLLRRLPAGLDGAGSCRSPRCSRRAPSPRRLAGRWSSRNSPSWASDGDLPGLFGAYLDVLFGVHVRLFARYGIAPGGPPAEHRAGARPAGPRPPAAGTGCW